MDILPGEIDCVKVIGTLFEDQVKIVKTVGGFNVAVGKKTKNSKKAEALAGGSHEAILSHQLTKDFGSDFQPALAKSESERLSDVENKTNYLPSKDITSGIELYTLSKNNNLEFVLYKRGLCLGSYKAQAKDDTLVLERPYFNRDLIKSDQGTAKAISRAMRDKMHELKLSKINKDWK